MILNTHNHKLDVNLKYTVGGAVYTVYASTEVQRCFSLFKSIRGEKTLALRFTSVEVGTVSNLVKGHQWKQKTAADIASTAGLHSMLAGEKLLWDVP
ncbi:unnamed protein product [Lampetra fluviatilis]